MTTKTIIFQKIIEKIAFLTKNVLNVIKWAKNSNIRLRALDSPYIILHTNLRKHPPYEKSKSKNEHTHSHFIPTSPSPIHILEY